MRRKDFTLIIIIIGIVLLIIVAVAVWYFTQNQSNSVGSYDEVPSAYHANVTESTSSITSSSWVTYTNAAYNFSFKYPAYLLVNGDSSTSSIILSQNTTSVLGAEYDLAVSMETNPNHLSLQQYFSNDINDNGANLYTGALVSTTTINSIPATVFSGSKLYDMTTEKVIIVPYLNGFLEIVNNNLDESAFDALLKTLTLGCVPSSCWGHAGCNYYTCTDGTTKFVY